MPDNDLLLRSLAMQPTPRVPVWLMRQAGRYLPEYRQLRAEAGDIIKLFKTPELACRAAMQPLERYPLDAAILFSDILTIPDAMGLGLYFVPGEGPRFERPLRSGRDIQRLAVPDPQQSLGYVLEAVRQTRLALNGKLPLIGFAGSPWTLATYMVEGGGGSDFKKIFDLMEQQPEQLSLLLDKLSQSVALYLDAQIEAGVHCIQIFDSWGGILPAELYCKWSLQWIQRAFERVRRTHGGQPVPQIIYSRGTGHSLEALGDSADAVGVDSDVELVSARLRLAGRAALQGNLDPQLLVQKNRDAAVLATRSLLRAWGNAPGLIFNLGQGLTPDADPDIVAAVIDAVRSAAPRPTAVAE